MKCCGEERATCFCPDCGKKLDDEKTLVGLLAYLRKLLKRYETLLKKNRARDWDTEPGERSVEKFSAWVNEVERVIAEADAKGA